MSSDELKKQKITPPGKGKGYRIAYSVISGNFPNKVINDLDFLHLLPISLPDLANQNLADKPVQHRLVQFRDGGILANLQNECPHIAFLLIGVVYHFGQSAL